MTQIIASITGMELTQILAAFGIILGGFYAFAYKQMRESRIEREASRIATAKALEDLSRSIEANTKTTTEFNTFLVRLNGSLKQVVDEKKEDKIKE